MADPAAGAFGVGAAIVVVLLRWAALAGRRPSVWLVGGLWCASRTAMAVALRTLPYARAGGLAESWRGGKAAPVGVGGAILAVALAWFAGVVPGLVAVGGVFLGAAAVLAVAQRRLGGFTGDVLGAAGLVGETAGLVLAAARW
jgi:adenosylcobinamide-GDP ribazoletransferase